MNDIRTIAAETAEILNKGFYLYDNAEVWRRYRFHGTKKRK